MNTYSSVWKSIVSRKQQSTEWLLLKQEIVVDDTTKRGSGKANPATKATIIQKNLSSIAQESVMWQDQRLLPQDS